MTTFDVRDVAPFSTDPATVGIRSARATPADESPYALTERLGKVLVRVENAYVDPVDRSKVLGGAIKGMVAELDPHSSYMPKDEFAAFQSDTEGKFGGVGLEVDGRDGRLVVIAPIEGSPAARAGVRSGDVVSRVDDVFVEGATLDSVVLKMRGKEGTHVKLTVRREGAPTPLSFDLTREVIHVASVVSKLLANDVLYVRVKQFQDGTHDEFVKAIADRRAEAKGRLRGVVLDLRSNPGGLVDEAASVADEFLDSGVVFTTHHRNVTLDVVHAEAGGALVGVPASVLVNAWSASASELVAGALQDPGRATVVGAETFGKGSVQTILELPDGAGMRLTTARYYTPKGHAIQADGVQPDVLVLTGYTDAETLKEGDLAGHLAPERQRPKRTPRRVVDVRRKRPEGAKGAFADDSGDTDVSLDVRKIPHDPSSGTDVALRVAYDTITKSP
ncbi:MAG: S41 family peptidase [Polyangiaceae bacterium]